MKYSKISGIYPGSVLLRVILLIVLWALFQQSYASISGLSGGANRTKIQEGKSVSVSITWTGTTTAITPNNNINVSVFSNSGSFIIPNVAVIGSVNKRISTSVTLSPLQPSDQFRIRETIQIPSSVVYTAKKQGSLIFQYTRTFNDDTGLSGTASGSVLFQIVSSSRGELILSRVDVRFDNDQIVRIVPIGNQVNAVADIIYTGTGLFDVAWEIARPASTQGEAFFSTLRTERRYLGAGRKAYLQSPMLPTDSTGIYFLRLKIRAPDTEIAPVEIKYVVIKSNRADEDINLVDISISDPLPNTFLKEDTEFNWEPINGVNAYQLEIYENIESTKGIRVPSSMEDIEPKLDRNISREDRSTGILLPGDKNSIRLTPIVKRHLHSGHSYRWRVIAVDDQGYIIGKSPMRTIHVP